MNIRTFGRIVSGGATAINAVAKFTGHQQLRRWSKPFIVPPLLNYKEPLLTLGGLCHWAGDLVLLRADRNLHQGALWFGLGHCALMAKFLQQGNRPQYVGWYCSAVLAVAVIVRDLKLASYAAVLAAMSSTSNSFGGPLFVLSDVLLLVNKRFPHPVIDTAAIATYGSAELLLFAPNNLTYQQVK